jgi:hypothetical protein
MPKRLWKIDKFEGGLNNLADPRDIRNNEVSYIQNMAVDRIGKVRTRGAFASHGTANFENGPGGSSGGNDGTEPGSGLFAFRSDYEGGTGSATLVDLVDGLPCANTSDMIVLVANSNTVATTTAVDIYSKENNVASWTHGLSGAAATNGFIVNGSASDREINFYEADGAVRAADMIDDAGGAASKVMWMGYIERNRFYRADGTTATNASDTWDGWFICDSGISAPTDGDLNFGKQTAISHPTLLTDCDGYQVSIATQAGLGSWPEGRFNAGITWIYDGVQESRVFPISSMGEVDVESGDALVVRISIFNDSATNANQTPNSTTNHDRLNPRITGGRVYLQETGTGTDAEDSTGNAWKFLAGWSAV